MVQHTLAVVRSQVRAWGGGDCEEAFPQKASSEYQLVEVTRRAIVGVIRGGGSMPEIRAVHDTHCDPLEAFR